MRRFLPILVVVLLMLPLFGAVGYAQDMMYQEAPMLAEQVAAGELPPVADRLPPNPLVVEPLNEIGTYGGTLRRGTAALITYMTYNMTYEPLVRWNTPISGEGPIQPNLAESWSSNDDQTVWTVNLRQGVKWSDGEDFTSEDVLFSWHDNSLNENVTGFGIGVTYQNGQPPQLEATDDYTLVFTYQDSYPLFAETQASLRTIALPKHYLSQFHPDYNEEATYEDYQAQTLLENGRGRHTLQAWMYEDFVVGEFYNQVRNPYYWKVDPEGNQLPYFDRVTIELVEDRQGVALGNVTGQFDFDTTWVGVQHIQLFSEAIQEGRDISLTFADFDGVAFHFNLDHADPVIRSAFRDVNFRRAVSIGINRQEIGDLFYAGLFNPSGSSLAPESGYYTAEDGGLWAQYDPEAARAMLEEAGYVDADGDGFREAPGGEALQLIIEVGIHDLYTPIVELVTEYFADIGLNAIMDANDQSLVRERYTAGDFMIHTWDRDGASYPFGAEMHGLAPTGPNTPFYHRNWEEDPVDDDFLRNVELMRTALTASSDERNELMFEVSNLHADNVWYISTGFWQRPFIKNNRLGNMAHRISRNGQLQDASAYQMETAYAKYEPGEGGS